MTPERASEIDRYRASKQALKERLASLRSALAESAALYRALRLPLLSSDAGPILRECDRRSLLGSHLLVIGTNAIAPTWSRPTASLLCPTRPRTSIWHRSRRPRWTAPGRSGTC